MAVTHIATTTDGVNGTSKAVATPSCQVGDLLLFTACHAEVASFGTVTGPGGSWAELAPGNEVSTRQVTFWKWADSTDAAGGGTHTISWTTSGNTVLFMSSFRGVHDTDPFACFRAFRNTGVIGTSLVWRLIGTAGPSQYMGYVIGAYGRGAVTLTIGNSYSSVGSQDQGGGGNSSSVRATAAIRTFDNGGISGQSQFTSSGSSSAGPSNSTHIALRSANTLDLTIRAWTDRVNQGSPTSITPVAPYNSQDGDRMIALFGSDEFTNKTVTAVPTGWTLLTNVRSATNGRELYIYYGTKAGSMGYTWTWNATVASLSHQIVAFSHTIANPFAASSTNNDTSSNTTLAYNALSSLPDEYYLDFVFGVLDNNESLNSTSAGHAGMTGTGASHSAGLFVLNFNGPGAPGSGNVNLGGNQTGLTAHFAIEWDEPPDPVPEPRTRNIRTVRQAISRAALRFQKQDGLYLPDRRIWTPGWSA